MGHLATVSARIGPPSHLVTEVDPLTLSLARRNSATSGASSSRARAVARAFAGSAVSLPSRASTASSSSTSAVSCAISVADVDQVLVQLAVQRQHPLGQGGEPKTEGRERPGARRTTLSASWMRCASVSSRAAGS